MSIPTSFDPLGTLGGNWREVDMDSFVNSTWTTSEFIPCGWLQAVVTHPENWGDVRSTYRGCMRSEASGLVFFGYRYDGTSGSVSRENNGTTDPGTVPPRNPGPTARNASIELWSLGELKQLKLEIVSTGTPPKSAYATWNDWKGQEGGPDCDWRRIEPLNIEGTSRYIIEVPFKAKSVIIRANNPNPKLNIDKIWTK